MLFLLGKEEVFRIAGTRLQRPPQAESVTHITSTLFAVPAFSLLLLALTLPASRGVEGFMALFISYSSQDKGAIEPLRSALHRAHHQVWMDEELGGGEAWWRTILEGGLEGIDGLFVHPVADEAVMAGNGTIGLELDEDASEFDTVVIPWGGGGLTSGVASSLKALRPEVRVVTVEPETGAPLAASLGHRKPREIDFCC